MNVRELINRGAKELQKTSESPRLDASLILAHTLNMDRAKLLACYPDSVASDLEEIYCYLIKKRSEGHPVAYILGEKEFFGYTYYVEEGVLTPRPDTEILVETAINLIENNKLKSALDMCTGTGCIAITLKKEITDLKVTATDISPVAERVFSKNNMKLVNGEVNFIHSNLFENLKGSKFDIIVTNPPYLTKDETVERVEGGWKEPALALDGGDDGLDLIRTIIKEAPAHLNKSGWLLIEAGPNQMEIMKKIMEEHSYKEVNIYKDIEERDRIVVGKYE